MCIVVGQVHCTVREMPISFNQAFSIHDDALLLRGRRSSVLASNIANVDTPNYKARDIDFAAELRRAAAGQENRITLASTHRDHLGASGGGGLPDIKYRNPLHPSLDGNTVDGHVEQARFAENAMQYQASFTFLDSKIRGLIRALKGE